MKVSGLGVYTFIALGFVIFLYVIFVEYWASSNWGGMMIFVLLGLLGWASERAHRSYRGLKEQRRQWELIACPPSSTQELIEVGLARATYGLKGVSAIECCLTAMALKLVANFVMYRLELLPASNMPSIIRILNDGLWFASVLGFAGSLVLYGVGCYNIISAKRLRKRLSLVVD